VVLLVQTQPALFSFDPVGQMQRAHRLIRIEQNLARGKFANPVPISTAFRVSVCPVLWS